MELELKEAEVLKLEPGDIVVLKTRSPISRDAADRLKSAVKAHFPEGVEVMVMDSSVSLSVLRPDKDQAVAA